MFVKTQSITKSLLLSKKEKKSQVNLKKKSDATHKKGFTLMWPPSSNSDVCCDLQHQVCLVNSLIINFGCRPKSFFCNKENEK